jgi:thiol-disulfide isomerase/thioredoxin
VKALVPVVLAVLLALAGCGSSTVDAAGSTAPAVATCLPVAPSAAEPSAVAPSAAASSVVAPSVAASSVVAPSVAASSVVAPSVVVAPPGGRASARIPDLTLDCFPSGGRVRLTELRRPAIVNLWASWCGPCRTELPAFQRFATTMGDRVLVLGVDTADSRDAGAGLMQDLKVTFPTLFDNKQRLLSGVGRSSLPVTLFVDADGGIRYLYNDVALDDAGIARLTRTHLGISA